MRHDTLEYVRRLLEDARMVEIRHNRGGLVGVRVIRRPGVSERGDQDSCKRRELVHVAESSSRSGGNQRIRRTNIA